MANAITGRESLSSILSGFTTLTKRLDKFIGQQEADAERFGVAEDAAKSYRKAAVDAAGRARRTRTKIVELIN